MGRAHGLPLLALLGMACATMPPVQPSQLEGWHAVAGDEFRLTGDVDPRELRALAIQLSLFSTVGRRLGGLPERRAPVPVTIFVFGDRALLDLFRSSPLVAGQILPTLEGYFAQLGATRHHAITRAILFHEYAHFLLRNHHRHAYPVWFDEGLSEYLSTLRVRGETVVVGVAPTDRLEWLARRGPMPLERLLADRADEVLSGEEVLDLYATSWALVHTLISSPDGRARLSRFSRALAAGASPQEAQAAAFGGGLEALAREIEEHVQRLARGVRHDLAIDARTLAPPRSWEIAPVPPADVAYELGYAALVAAAESEAREFADVALALLTAAVEMDPSHQRAAAALAEAHARAGDADRAREMLAGLSRGDADARVTLHVARVHAAELAARADDSSPGSDRVERAVAAYRRAVELAPEAPAAHAGLARTYRRGGLRDEAIEAYERARALGAWSPDLDLELAGLYVDAGRPADARVLLTPLAHYPHSDEVASQARRLLSGMGEGGSGSRAGGERAAPRELRLGGAPRP